MAVCRSCLDVVEPSLQALVWRNGRFRLILLPCTLKPALHAVHTKSVSVGSK